MRIKVAQWNIGGGKIRDSQIPNEGPYNIDDIEYISEILDKENLDIITLQETHSTTSHSQARMLSDTLSLPFYINDVYDDSHLEAGQKLGQSVISRFPILESTFSFFLNPKFEKQMSNGHIMTSHDKGVSKVKLEINPGTVLEIGTLHLIPFRIFEVDPLTEENRALRENMMRLIKMNSTKAILQGDFNFDSPSLKNLFPEIFIDDMSEVLSEVPTTPKGRMYDHVLFKGVEHLQSRVLSEVLTDHYPIISEFEV